MVATFLLQKEFYREDTLLQSTNDYDWLGHGVYFWEGNAERALQFAYEMMKKKNSSVKNPAVLGAVIDLGYCLDLTESSCLEELKMAYDVLEKSSRMLNKPMPQNSTLRSSSDLLLRRLDCAVIEMAHTINDSRAEAPYDSVKGVFWEGNELYPNAGFREKDHIQICVRNPNCIKGYFRPRDLDLKYPNP